MNRNIESGHPSPEQGGKVNNLADLKKFIEKELGVYASLFDAAINGLAGYENPKGFGINHQAEQARKESTLANAQINQEVLDGISKVIEFRVNLTRGEIKGCEGREGMEEYVKECQKILALMENKRLVMDSQGNVSFQEIDWER
ncbi:MAG: hypothetical protein Q8P20_01855 [bacterium]|nr:hypothetical protein [bacterium]